MSNRFFAGVDVGASSVKVAVVESDDGSEGRVVATAAQRIRRRAVADVVDATFAEAIARAGVPSRDFAYIASTGDGDAVAFRTGHFFSMTAHGRGGLFLEPRARAVLDVGALHARAIRIDGVGKVLAHQMTSQCASGTGQFFENIARYLGVPLEEVSQYSVSAQHPEQVSSICAVLAETDVINMVARGIQKPDILHGIHLSLASRLARLLRAAGATGVVAITGGLASDAGLLRALDATLKKDQGDKPALEMTASPEAVAAGAIGAALLGARRTAIDAPRVRGAAVIPGSS